MNAPFSPALNVALDLLAAQLQQSVRLLLEREARHLGLKGVEVNVEKREWVTPEPKES